MFKIKGQSTRRFYDKKYISDGELIYLASFAVIDERDNYELYSKTITAWGSEGLLLEATVPFKELDRQIKSGVWKIVEKPQDDVQD
jgi:hypothetical protein